jgi:hypothetical protein
MLRSVEVGPFARYSNQTSRYSSAQVAGEEWIGVMWHAKEEPKQSLLPFFMKG